jgi:hypothetical protein
MKELGKIIEVVRIPDLAMSFALRCAYMKRTRAYKSEDYEVLKQKNSYGIL